MCVFGTGLTFVGMCVKEFPYFPVLVIMLIIRSAYFHFPQAHTHTFIQRHT